MEKILDVILSSPGTRIGQASECFVYWKDDRRNDTWGLNFTSPIDAKQFRECCDFSKSSARYLYKNGLRLGSKVCFIYKSYILKAEKYPTFDNIAVGYHATTNVISFLSLGTKLGHPNSISN